MSNDASIEHQIRQLGLTAPRITPAQVDALVQDLSYHTYVVPGTTTTIAAAIDPAGFVVALGTASCVSPENFNEALGRNAAISKATSAARDELWKLEGYRLKRNLVEAHKVGLLANLALYKDDASAVADPAFVADLASGHCAAQVNLVPSA